MARMPRTINDDGSYRPLPLPGDDEDDEEFDDEEDDSDDDDEEDDDEEEQIKPQRMGLKRPLRGPLDISMPLKRRK